MRAILPVYHNRLCKHWRSRHCLLWNNVSQHRLHYYHIEPILCRETGTVTCCSRTAKVSGFVEWKFHHIKVLRWSKIDIWVRFPSLARSKLRLCLANHRAGYFSNLTCDWLSIAWAYSEQETENGPWIKMVTVLQPIYWNFSKILWASTQLCQITDSKTKFKTNITWLSTLHACWWPSVLRKHWNWRGFFCEASPMISEHRFK